MNNHLLICLLMGNRTMRLAVLNLLVLNLGLLLQSALLLLKSKLLLLLCRRFALAVIRLYRYIRELANDLSPHALLFFRHHSAGVQLELMGKISFLINNFPSRQDGRQRDKSMGYTYQPRRPRRGPEGSGRWR